MQIIKILIFIACITGYVLATEYYVQTPEEISAAMSAAQPGDTLTMANGVWQDAYIVFSGDGAENNPILLRAETPGFVNLTGISRLRIAGTYLVVDGLRFLNGRSSGGAVIEFRNGSSDLASNCRLTNTGIINYNAANINTNYKWVSVYGNNNRVDHCYFYGKNHLGTTLVIWFDRVANPPAHYHRIDHNYFAYRPELGFNGGETIRIGTSDYSMNDSYSVVESNYFENCDGEIEIISNKSGNNTFRYNTFYECEGTLTLRHGNYGKIYSNYFDGNNNSRSGGIRVIGENHIIYNNHFTRLGGDGSRSALSIENGVPNSPLNRYFQVINAQIVHNTFVGNDRNITIGTGSSTERTLPPKDCTIANNVVYGTKSPLIDKDDEPINLTWLTNIFFGADLGITQPDGISIVDPLLAMAEDGLMRPAENSPVKDAATENFAFVVDDFDGQIRPNGEFDIGSDEISADLIVRKPVTPDSVGPVWLTDPSLPKVLAIQIDGTGRVELDPPGGLYEPDTWVRLTAIGEENWTFASWGGDLSGSNPNDSILIDDNKTVIARFDPPVKYKIVPWIVGQGTLEYDPPGNSYDPGTVVWITAKPADGWVFDSWSGSLAGSNNPDSVVMDADKAIQAKFADVSAISDADFPLTYYLAQNYPNPFNPETSIRFSLEKPGYTVLEIYSSSGKKIKTLVNVMLHSGTHQVTFSAANLASGVYLYRLTSGGFTSLKKMILLK